jgi:hypothetical protein
VRVRLYRRDVRFRRLAVTSASPRSTGCASRM